MTDLGYTWIVYPRRGTCRQWRRATAKSSTAQTLIEVVLLSEDLAERGELTGPGGRAWTCRLGDSNGAEDPMFPRWEPEKP
jgi:hypothetical protein